MFNQTIVDITAEIQWIVSELSRQSTSREQELKLLKKKNALIFIRLLCDRYLADKYELDTSALKELMFKMDLQTGIRETIYQVLYPVAETTDLPQSSHTSQISPE